MLITYYSRSLSQLSSNAPLSGKSCVWTAGVIYHDHPQSPTHNLGHSAPIGQNPPKYSISHRQLYLSSTTPNKNRRLRLTPKLAPLKINSNFISPLEIVKSRLYLAM